MSMRAPGLIHSYTGQAVPAIEVELTDGGTVEGSTYVKLRDEGVWIGDGNTETLYPWHRVKEVRGLPPN